MISMDGFFFMENPFIENVFFIMENPPVIIHLELVFSLVNHPASLGVPLFMEIPKWEDDGLWC